MTPSLTAGVSGVRRDRVVMQIFRSRAITRIFRNVSKLDLFFFGWSCLCPVTLEMLSSTLYAGMKQFSSPAPVARRMGFAISVMTPAAHLSRNP